MLLKKLWRTMGLYKAQFISMIIMIAIGVGVFCGFNIEWTSIRDDTAKFFKETGFADYRIASKAGFTKQDEEKIKNIDGVDETSRYLAVNVSVESVSGTSLSLTVTENKKVSFFKIIEGEEYSKNIINIYLDNAYSLAKLLKTRGVKFFGGENSPYVFFEKPLSWGKIAAFDYLFDKFGIAVTPGEGFIAFGKNYARISCLKEREEFHKALRIFEKVF